ncbi:putative 17 kDa surface antigen (plasmid) [Magnetospirillum sp. XM-1]|uniref:glycine zipper 2TM domain-containing protein n=1 Tax=unclassified Magnetospirillum TaxID=2617991 RepID=UPI00073DFEAC|nr:MULTISPECIES: glycine zipper 2TM domain-containing protein [unclassified Magnetospirillum]ARJ66040.1 hypothetical protein WV31_10415 [Magnetospirillum sp. ME-1]CUW41962.1 putative 17 kDa surface antigen [Magnetospirillum sp. XM-1]
MKKFTAIAAALALSASLSACAGMPGANGQGGFQLDKQTIGTGIGAALGGLGGSMFGGGNGKLIGTAAGVAIGGYLGNQIGASLDRADKAYADRSLSQLQPGQSNSWQSSTGSRMTFVAGPQVQTPQNAPQNSVCRTYQLQTFEAKGGGTQSQGTACTADNGSTWNF